MIFPCVKKVRILNFVYKMENERMELLSLKHKIASDDTDRVLFFYELFRVT